MKLLPKVALLATLYEPGCTCATSGVAEIVNDIYGCFRRWPSCS